MRKLSSLPNPYRHSRPVINVINFARGKLVSSQRLRLQAQISKSMVEQEGEMSEDVVRSRISRINVPVRFKNRTGRRVKIVWLNYHGEEVPYATLDTFSSYDSTSSASRSYFLVDTFVTNPWIAVDESSNERMLLNFQEVYFPSPPQVRRMDYDRRRAVVVRTDVLITAPVYTLEEYCKQTIQKLVSKQDITMLPLPVMLLNDLMKMYQGT